MDSGRHTTYIINLKSKFSFVTYTNIHSGLTINKARMNSYETIVSANRVWNIYCIQRLLQWLQRPHRHNPVNHPASGRTELQHFSWEMKICLTFKHFQKRRLHNLLWMASYTTYCSFPGHFPFLLTQVNSPYFKWPIEAFFQFLCILLFSSRVSMNSS